MGKQEIEPTFNIDASTVTHEQFWYKLDEMNDSYDYYLEIKCGKTDHWLKKKRITNKKRNNIFDLKWDTNYRVRIRAENKRNKKISYSKVSILKTKDKKWKNKHLPTIPNFKYSVSSNNKKIIVEFNKNELDQIKQTKFDERYCLDI